MLKYKTYVKILSLILFSIFAGTFLYIYIYAKSYPIPLFHRISLDAKMKFVRDMNNKDQIDTIIIGSSIGLNNIQGTVLEESSKKIRHVLNLSALGLTTTQVEQLSKLFSLFPNIKRVIYSTQFEDYSGAFLFEENQVKHAKKYILLGKHTIDIPYTFYTYKHFIEFVKNNWKWKKEYAHNKTNHGLLFDRTGSVPLDMFGDNINHRMFATPPLDTKLYKENFLALENIAKSLRAKNIKFYFVAEPYRQYMIEHYNNIRIARDTFIKTAKEISTKNGGIFIDLHPKLQLNDDFFVDREHLNTKGSTLTAKAVSKLIDAQE